jgi:hypothetical protein
MNACVKFYPKQRGKDLGLAKARINQQKTGFQKEG